MQAEDVTNFKPGESTDQRQIEKALDCNQTRPNYISNGLRQRKIVVVQCI
jgi:hypothetical protein